MMFSLCIQLDDQSNGLHNMLRKGMVELASFS